MENQKGVKMKYQMLLLLLGSILLANAAETIKPDDVKEALKNYISDVATVLSEFATAQDLVASTQKSLEEKIKELENEKGVHATEATDLKQQLDSATTDLADHKEKVTTLEKQLEELETNTTEDAATKQAAIDELTTKLEAAQTAFAASETDYKNTIEELQTKVDALTGTSTETAKKLATYQSAMEEMSSALATAQTALATSVAE